MRLKRCVRFFEETVVVQVEKEDKVQIKKKGGFELTDFLLQRSI